MLLPGWRHVVLVRVAETSEPGLGSNCPAADWGPFFLQGFGSGVFDGDIVPCGVCAC